MEWADRSKTMEVSISWKYSPNKLQTKKKARVVRKIHYIIIKTPVYRGTAYIYIYRHIFYKTKKKLN